jgi:plastocyanin
MKRTVLAAAALVVAGLVAAADLDVSIRGASGRPAPDVVVMLFPAGAPAAPPARSVDIVQQGNRFEPYVTAVPAGTAVRFVNRDRYDHHVRSLGSGPMGAVPPVKSFELRLGGVQGGAKAIDTLTFEAAGTITLGCHIHGSMRGHLFVAATPWVAVTDDQGVARFSGLPDGTAEMRLWHPDQLTGPAAQTLTLSGQASASAQLGFNPPRRPAPRPKGEYEF